jgi:hypothetical protein
MGHSRVCVASIESAALGGDGSGGEWFAGGPGQCTHRHIRETSSLLSLPRLILSSPAGRDDSPGNEGMYVWGVHDAQLTVHASPYSVRIGDSSPLHHHTHVRRIHIIWGTPVLQAAETYVLCMYLACYHYPFYH